MSVSDNGNGLEFACECLSGGLDGYSDPWASIAKNKLLPDGTKEEILNLVSRESKTISQLADALDLSPPSIYTHINDMMKSELLRESEEREKKHPAERYYEPNFPVVKADERAEFDALCQEIADRVADLFEKKCPQMERAFKKTNLANRSWTFSDVVQYLYANVQRNARELLEKRGTLPARKRHANGVKWIFWAEEPAADTKRKSKRD